MEASGLLDPLNEIHLLSLHVILLQKINKSLQELTSQRNYHGLSTGGSLPLQLNYLHSLIPIYSNVNESVTHYVELGSAVCEMLPNSIHKRTRNINWKPLSLQSLVFNTVLNELLP